MAWRTIVLEIACSRIKEMMQLYESMKQAYAVPRKGYLGGGGYCTSFKLSISFYQECSLSFWIFDRRGDSRRDRDSDLKKSFFSCHSHLKKGRNSGNNPLTPWNLAQYNLCWDFYCFHSRDPLGISLFQSLTSFPGAKHASNVLPTTEPDNPQPVPLKIYDKHSNSRKRFYISAPCIQRTHGPPSESCIAILWAH